MNRNSNSPLASAFVNGKPTSSTHAVETSMRESGGFVRFAKVRYIAPTASLQPCNTATLKRIDVVKVAGLQGSKAASAVVSSTTKRFRVTILEDGEPKEILTKLVMTKIAVLSYGMVFSFTMKRGSGTCVDSRTGCRVALLKVQSELCRMLGDSLGNSKFAEFVA